MELAFTLITFAILMIVFMIASTACLAVFAFFGSIMRWLWDICTNVFAPRK